MRWGVLVQFVLVAAAVGVPSIALAAPEISLDPGPDGSLEVVGNGWRPGQRLVVSLGRASYAALADSTGGFEVPTGLTSYQGPVAVHRRGTSSLAIARIGPSEAANLPHPLAVLFAQTMASGLGFCALVGGAVGLGIAAARRFNRQ